MWRSPVLLVVVVWTCFLLSVNYSFHLHPPATSYKTPVRPSRRAWHTRVSNAPSAPQESLADKKDEGTGEVDDAAAAAQAAAEEQERKRLEREKLEKELGAQKTRNGFTAVASALAGFSFFFYQHLYPVEGLTLLRRMQAESPSIAQVVSNGRPTVVDFYAEWCENCREMAPVLREVESRYSNRVNFVVVNGDSSENMDLVTKFRVDGIPHLALISKEGEVKTALIGTVPKKVIEADLDSLIVGKDLPYEGYDAFEDEDHHVQL